MQIKRTQKKVTASTEDYKKSGLVDFLDKKSVYHEDIAPEDSDTLDDLLDKFFYWVDEYNDGYFDVNNIPEGLFGRWLKQQYLDHTAVNSASKITTNKNYQAAQNYIKCAIDALAACGKADEFAKDNIANLSTVYFDLDSGKGDA